MKSESSQNSVHSTQVVIQFNWLKKYVETGARKNMQSYFWLCYYQVLVESFKSWHGLCVKALIKQINFHCFYKVSSFVFDKHYAQELKK